MTPSILTAILNWLRAGYPNGVPEQDYVPLFALLSRRLSADEVQQVARAVIQRTDGNTDVPDLHTDIGVMITKITDQLPRDEDVARVRSKLAAAGWPLADPSSLD